MKQKIFNKGHGWYISCSNYKDNQDKCFISLYFPNGTTPPASIGNQGYAVEDIDIQEAKFNSYKKYPGLTIFKYEIIYSGEKTYDKGYEVERQDGIPSISEEELDDYEKNFGGSIEGNIEMDELPFY